MNLNGNNKLAAPCGLYCGICSDFTVNKVCHGCGCECGKCAGEWHYNHCNISQCAHNRNLESCAECDELPCTQLIQFTHNPVWTTHSNCIDNLKRRLKLGTEKWIEEQEEYYSDESNRKQAILHHEKCSIKSKEWGL